MSFADVEIRHLTALRAVAEHGTFAAAAAHLGFTQSAVSQQIAGLERVVGTPVFDRPGGPRPVALTPAGVLLVGHASTILDRLRVAGEDLRRLLDGDAGTLVIGTFQSVSVALLPPIIGRMRRERPDVEIRLVELPNRDGLIDGLADGTFDLTFLDVAECPGAVVTPLFVEPYLLVSPTDGTPPRDGYGPARPDEVAGLPLIGENEDSCCTINLVQAYRAHGVEPNYIFRSGDNGAIQALVRSGMGHAIMADLAIDRTDPGVVIRPLDPVINRTVAVAAPQGRTITAAANRFLELTVEVVGNRLAA